MYHIGNIRAVNLYQNLTFKIQIALLFVVCSSDPYMGARPPDLAPSAESYHFSNFAGACL